MNTKGQFSIPVFFIAGIARAFRPSGHNVAIINRPNSRFRVRFRHSASHLIVIYYMEACHQSGKHGHFMDGININIHAFEFAGKRSWLHGPRAFRNCARHRFRERKTKLGFKYHFKKTLLEPRNLLSL